MCLNYLKNISQTWWSSIGNNIFYNKLSWSVSELPEKDVSNVGFRKCDPYWTSRKLLRLLRASLDQKKTRKWRGLSNRTARCAFIKSIFSILSRIKIHVTRINQSPLTPGQQHFIRSSGFGYPWSKNAFTLRGNINLHKP